MRSYCFTCKKQERQVVELSKGCHSWYHDSSASPNWQLHILFSASPPGAYSDLPTSTGEDSPYKWTLNLKITFLKKFLEVERNLNFISDMYITKFSVPHFCHNTKIAKSTALLTEALKGDETKTGSICYWRGNGSLHVNCCWQSDLPFLLICHKMQFLFAWVCISGDSPHQPCRWCWRRGGKVFAARRF